MPMRLPLRLAAAALATLLVPGPAEAWTGKTRIRIADEAVRLLPASLRLALARHREPLLKGLVEPTTHEDGAEHLPPSSGGRLDVEIAARAAELVRLVESGAPFREIARAFGALAHFVGDAGFPPAAAGREGSAHYADFAAFAESRMARFPLVFLGHDDPELASGDFRAFARREIERARGEYAHVARTYAAAGSPPDPAAFDDRSVPFAVASLAYSRTVTLVARAWLAAWRQAGGDVGRTPYLRPKPGPPGGDPSPGKKGEP